MPAAETAREVTAATRPRRSPRGLVALGAVAAMSAAITVAANAGDWDRATLYVLLALALALFLLLALPIVAPPSPRDRMGVEELTARLVGVDVLLREAYQQEQAVVVVRIPAVDLGRFLQATPGVGMIAPGAKDTFVLSVHPSLTDVVAARISASPHADILAVHSAEEFARDVERDAAAGEAHGPSSDMRGHEP